MENGNIYNDALEFRQIVLSHIKRILEISNHELKDGSYTTIQGNYTQVTRQEDSRYNYIQSIENLAYILLPHFDSKIKDVYKKCIKIIGAFGYEVRRDFKKEYDEASKLSSNIDRAFVIGMKLKSAKELFIALNLLLKRNDYLKSAVYGESADDDEIIEDEEDEE